MIIIINRKAYSKLHPEVETTGRIIQFITTYSREAKTVNINTKNRNTIKYGSGVGDNNDNFVHAYVNNNKKMITTTKIIALLVIPLI
jgi:hypothetical protein